MARMSLFKNKTLLITGGTGSFAFVRLNPGFATVKKRSSFNGFQALTSITHRYIFQRDTAIKVHLFKEIRQ